MDNKKNCQKLPKSHRLKQSKEFNKVYAEGKKIIAQYLVLFGLENNLGYWRLGITVSKRIGNAVQRNRAKRLLREVFRRNRPVGPVSYDLVANAKRNLPTVTYRELEKDFLRTIVKLSPIAGPQPKNEPSHHHHGHEHKG